MNLDELQALIDRLHDALALLDSAGFHRQADDGREAANALVALRIRAEDAERRLAVYNSGGFTDADALAERFITLTAERDARDEVIALRRQLRAAEVLIAAQSGYDDFEKWQADTRAALQSTERGEK